MNPQTLRATPARSLTALTSLLLAVGLLAGCAQGEDTPAADTTASSTVAADDDASESADDATSDDATDGSADDVELTYEGVAGKTALELLVAADPTAVVQGEGENAFVTGIDGREAQDSAKEFWALYVNGEMAQVGAGSLVTETGDEITWKLETY
ncbi:DUF4430 domain-containing protein [Oerskovia enterophila]|uniref:Transcobalamin-like C-terminal domain-containing protein n=1 Tax=Oerskovia enterophila TaxID=43678 RepID=A0A161YIL8_9CELL|nr:DUF4430 domain-containing protein [Oerskovia enterophila]KZM36078.1 hypothetical protein OJAG_12820 [Oerskovia enterophila]OCI32308.1 hypothetical protein OERS_09170 [Oerskovia enterophila]